ncbi:nucleotide-binding protein [Patescibacteria group bacterium]|nr:nucleotide-binding protein [Patescibacteria group bacterium]
MRNSTYDDNVFINCPFDKDYKPIFNAILFAIFDCGFVPRCTFEEVDASQIRIEKIYKIISSCRYGIHDISRTELDSKNKLPRFNMPLELGLFLGAKRFGDKRHNKKACLIFDRKPYRYQKFISDISGQDIRGHNSKPKTAIKEVRDWLRGKSKRYPPDGSIIWNRYEEFQKDLLTTCKELQLDSKSPTYGDYLHLITKWLKEVT